MTVNGRPRWTCRTHVSKVVEDGSLEIGPLANLPVIKRSRRRHRRRSSRSGRRPRAPSSPSSTRHDRMRSYRRRQRRASPPTPRSSASTAAVCYAACDTVRWNRTTSVPRLSTARGRSSTTCAMPATSFGSPPRRAMAAATPATRTRAARSFAPSSSTRRRRSPVSSAGRCRPTSAERSVSANVRLYVLQRATAAVMAPLVLVHLSSSSMRPAGAFSAAEILGRTRGSVAWGLFYGPVRAGGVDARRDRRARVASRMARLAREARTRSADVGFRRASWPRSACGPSPRWCCRERAQSAPPATVATRCGSRRWCTGLSGLAARLLPAAAFPRARAGASTARRGSTASCSGPRTRWSSSPRRPWSSCWPCTCWAASACSSSRTCPGARARKRLAWLPAARPSPLPPLSHQGSCLTSREQ